MKKVLIFLISLGFLSPTSAQHTDDCATKVSNFLDIDLNLLKQNQLLYTTPYQLRLFIHIIANDNGSSIAVANQAAFNTYLEGTRAYYAAHNICFSLVGVRQPDQYA